MPVPISPNDPSVALPGRRSKYLPQLDGLRGLAILSVLLHHFDVHLPVWLDWGPVGVRVFFLLSGYLITLSLWKMATRVAEGGSYWRGMWDFHERRIIRLTPVLYLMLIICLLIGLEEYRTGFVWFALFLTNIHIAMIGYWPGAASHLWSLAVQEQFYVLWPFVILVTPRRILPWVLGAITLVAISYRVWVIGSGASPFLQWVLLPGVMDTFAFGALIACWKASGNPFPLASGKVGWAVAILAIGCFAVARAFRYAPFVSPVLALTDTFENAFLGWVMLRTIVGWPGWIGRLFESRTLVYLGKISYGLYVFHVLVHVVCGPWLDRAGLADFAFIRAVLLIGISVGVAALSWKFIEYPLTCWIRSRDAAKREKAVTPIGATAG